MRIYQIAWYPILLYQFAGILLLSMCFWDIKGVFSHPFVFIMEILVSFVFSGYSLYLWKRKKEGKGFYWDDEGVVVNLKGNKVYWNEIEDIRLSKGRVGKSTVIYPHYTYHEKIRIRHQKHWQTTAYSFEWYLVEKPREMHQLLIEKWQEKKNERKEEEKK